MLDRLAIKADGLRNLESPRAGVLMNSSDDLIALARSGNQEAFGLLFERYARPVLGFIHNLVGRADIAEELTQETFVRAFRGLSEFRERATFSTWLFGIARNVTREWTRTREASGQTTNSDELINHDAGKGTPVEDLLDKELNLAMVQALKRLDEDKRTVFALKVFQQLSYQEIVQITGFSLAKVKIELHRARAEMRQHLRVYLEMQ